MRRSTHVAGLNALAARIGGPPVSVVTWTSGDTPPISPRHSSRRTHHGPGRRQVARGRGGSRARDMRSSRSRAVILHVMNVPDATPIADIRSRESGAHSLPCPC